MLLGAKTVAAVPQLRSRGGCRSKLVCSAAQQTKATTPAQFLKKAALIACEGTAVTALLLGCVTTPALAAQSTLADVVRQEFAILQQIDNNKDGIVTKSEIIEFAKKTAEDEYFPLPSEDQLDFTMRVFDLNQDNKLTMDELLSSIALDRALDEDDNVVTEAVFKVFDKNNDGGISQAEFRATLGDLGPNGEELKDYIYQRENMISAGNRSFDNVQLANALTMTRTAVLGY